MDHETRRPGEPSSIDETATTATGVVNFFKTVRKHWAMVFACAILAGGSSLLYARSIPPTYEATASVEFDPKPIRPLGDTRDGVASFTSYWDNKEYFETQHKIMTSDRVLAAVVTNLGLQNDPAFAPGAKPDGKTRSPSMSVEDLAALLRGRVKVEPIKGTRLVIVHVEDTDPKRAARVADAVVATYIGLNTQNSVVATSDVLVWLNGQVDHFKQEL
ncbi:hypothetical protein EON77_21065, partial [bacterium]